MKSNLVITFGLLVSFLIIFSSFSTISLNNDSSVYPIKSSNHEKNSFQGTNPKNFQKYSSNSYSTSTDKSNNINSLSTVSKVTQSAESTTTSSNITISNTNYNSQIYDNNENTISSDITDNSGSGLKIVLLFYRKDTDRYYKSIEMKCSGWNCNLLSLTTPKKKASIGPFTSFSGYVSFYILAINNNWENETSPTYSFNVIPSGTPLPVEPDLNILNFESTNITNVAYTYTKFNILVQNTGTENIQNVNYTLNLQIDSKKVESIVLSINLNINQIKTFEIYRNLTEGYHILHITLKNNIKEISNKNNEFYSIDNWILAPNLKILNIISPKDPKVGLNNISIQIANYGHKEAKNFFIRIYNNGIFIENYLFNITIFQGESNITFINVSLHKGLNELNFQINPKDSLIEENYNDNGYDLYLMVPLGNISNPEFPPIDPIGQNIFNTTINYLKSIGIFNIFNRASGNLDFTQTLNYKLYNVLNINLRFATSIKFVNHLIIFDISANNTFNPILNSSIFAGNYRFIRNFINKLDQLGINSSLLIYSSFQLEMDYNTTNGSWTVPIYTGNLKISINLHSSDLIELLINLLNPNWVKTWNDVKNIASISPPSGNLEVSIDLGLKKLSNTYISTIAFSIIPSVALNILNCNFSILISGSTNFWSNTTGGYFKDLLGIYFAYNLNLGPLNNLISFFIPSYKPSGIVTIQKHETGVINVWIFPKKPKSQGTKEYPYGGPIILSSKSQNTFSQIFYIISGIFNNPVILFSSILFLPIGIMTFIISISNSMNDRNKNFKKIKRRRK